MSFLKYFDDQFYRESSLLSSEKLVEWKKKRGVYNVKSTPKTAIIVLNKSIISPFINFMNKKIKGINGSNYIINNDILLCSDFGSGASAVITHMEELRVLGTKEFIFIGVAGFINPAINQNEPYIISSAHSTLGSSYFYSKKEVLSLLDKEWIHSIKKKLSLEESICWSTDNAFRETPSLIETFKNKGAHLVDMECAAIYAFSEFYKVPSLSILVAADSLCEITWEPPQNMKALVKTQRNVIANIIKILNSK